MANTYDEQLSHMSHLMFYGANNESKKNSKSTSVMNLKEGADGKMYGIVSEGTKYYIKSCKKGDEQLAESFDYIGGFLNRRSCEYSSYADAVKDMNMRLMSLNEDHGKRMPVNEMKRSADFMDKDMVEMQEEIARHRQILENIDVIYQNKKSGIGDRNIGVPEAPETQEYNSKVGDPFEDKADYEENRDNKETAKDHEKQGGPFEDETEYEESTDNIQKKDSNTPGDTYTDKTKYVPDNAVAAMHPQGGKVVRVNEEIDDVNDLLGYYDGEDGPTNEPEYVDETSFPEENPDLAAAEHGEMGDPMDDLSPEEIGPGTSLGDDDLENDDFLSQFSDSEEYVDGEDVAGIDDMSGVDRNNLSADMIDNVVSEMVDKFSKSKKLDMISESVALSILNEADKPERQYYHDDDFEYGVPEKRPSPDDEYKPSSLQQYMDKGSRVPNKSKKGILDPRKGAPSYVNPGQVDYDPESEYYLQNKFELGLNDDPKGDYTESGAWKATDEKSRKYTNARVAKAQEELELIGKETNIDTSKVVDLFRHSLYILQDAKNNLAIICGIHPEMIEKFLQGNKLSSANDNLAMGYKDAVKIPTCIITPDGELPLSAGAGYKRMENKNFVAIPGVGIIGPSLKAMGFPEMTTEELNDFIDNWLFKWDEEFGSQLEKSENEMRDSLDYVRGLLEDANVPAMRNVVTEWVELVEDLAGLQSFAAIPAEVSNKRMNAANIVKMKASEGDEEDDYFDEKPKKGKSRGKDYDDEPTPEEIENDAFIQRAIKDAVNEEITKLNVFGDHPGYRKKPMTTPANVEVAPNDARDWNDDSTKGEEPFGKQIGSSAPYSDIVDTVTREVLKAIKGGLK